MSYREALPNVVSTLQIIVFYEIPAKKVSNIFNLMIYEEETLSVVGRGPQGRRETYQRFTKYY